MYVQRQCSAIMIPGDDTSAAAKGMGSKLFDASDTYPSNILVVDDAGLSAGAVEIAAAGSQALPLPAGYVAAQWLGIFIECEAIAKVVVVSSAHTTSTHLVKADSTIPGICQYMDTGVTSITLTNNGSATATFKYFLFQYPEDLDANASWRSGSQTTGTL